MQVYDIPSIEELLAEVEIPEKAPVSGSLEEIKAGIIAMVTRARGLQEEPEHQVYRPPAGVPDDAKAIFANVSPKS